jgi:hypothetical protein
MCEIIPLKRPDILGTKPEAIKLVKAAICQGDKVYTGWRHFQILNFMKSIGCESPGSHNQGFVDQDGCFYRRSSCSYIASVNGQTKKYIDPLTSEDLWKVDGSPLEKQNE